MDINAFEQAEAECEIAQHISKAIRMHEDHGILSGDESSSLGKIYTRLANNCSQKTKEMAALPYQEYEKLRAQQDGQAKLKWYSDEMRTGKPQPPTLFRFVEGNQAMDNHLAGKLWFRSPWHFRSIEGERKDVSEGIGSYALPNGKICRDVNNEAPISFILCFSEQAESLQKFGEYCLKVSHPLELKRRVECRLSPGSRVEWRKIIYDKVMQLDTNPSPTEDWNRTHYSKPKKFADDKEWRLVIFLPMRLLNDTLKVHVGDLLDVFDLIRSPMRSE